MKFLNLRTSLSCSTFSMCISIYQKKWKDFEKVTSKIKYSKLRFCHNLANNFQTPCGWLTENGNLLGEIDQPSETPAFIIDKEEIRFPSDLNGNSRNETKSKTGKIPQTFVMTDFQAVLLYNDQVTAIALLNQPVVNEEYFADQYGKLLDVVKDPLIGAGYVYSSKAILRYETSNEKRNAWEIYLEKKNNLELAHEYSRDRIQVKTQTTMFAAWMGEL